MIQRKIKKVSFLILFLLSCSILCFAQKAQFLTVRGRIVDEKGNPVNGAFVSMTDYKPPKNSIDWLILGEKTDESGNFEISTYTTLTKIKTYLFVASSIAQEASRPIDSPFTILLKKKQLKGIPITLEKDKVLDVGDLKIQVYFRLVELFVIKNNKPFYETNKDWHEFKLIIRDEKGVVAGSEALSIKDINEIVNVEKGSVMLALPVGTWTFELLSDWDDLKLNKSFVKSEKISIPKGDSPLTVTLRIKN